MRIEDMLESDEAFDLHFCSLTTIKNLRGVPVSALRKSIKALHEIIGFRIMASPRLWTHEESEKTIVVAGKLSVDGKTTGERFGLCVDIAPRDTAEPKALYLWASRSLVDRLTLKAELGEGFQNKWVPWRYRAERKVADKYCRYSIPIAEVQSGEWRIALNKNEGELPRFLAELKGYYQVPLKTLRIMKPMLDLIGHDGSFISPVAIDLHRHPDITANETDDVSDRGVSVATRRIFQSKFSAEEFFKEDALRFNGPSKGHKIAIHRFEGAELFSCAEATPPADLLPFMNLSFSANKDVDPEALKGSGLYGVFFKAEADSAPKLIYVGLFKNGKIGSGSAFEGSVLRDRWVKHIATCSLRGHNLGIGQRTAKYSRIILGTHPLAALGHPDVANAIVRDRGCNAGENRVTFASRNWDRLVGMGTEVHHLFSFSYVRIGGLRFNEDDDDIRRVVEASEKRLKTILSPICNGETPLSDHLPHVEIAEFERIAASLLCNQT